MLQRGVDATEGTQRFSVVGDHGQTEAVIASRFSDDPNIACKVLTDTDGATNQRLIAIRDEGFVCAHALASAASKDKSSDQLAVHVVRKGD